MLNEAIERAVRNGNETVPGILGASQRFCPLFAIGGSGRNNADLDGAAGIGGNSRTRVAVNENLAASLRGETNQVWARYFNALADGGRQKSLNSGNVVGLLLFVGPYFQMYANTLRAGHPLSVSSNASSSVNMPRSNEVPLEANRNTRQLRSAVERLELWNEATSTNVMQRALQYIRAVASADLPIIANNGENSDDAKILEYLNRQIYNSMLQSAATAHQSGGVEKKSSKIKDTSASASSWFKQVLDRSVGGSQGGDGPSFYSSGRPVRGNASNSVEGWRWVYQLAKSVNYAITVCLQGTNLDIFQYRPLEAASLSDGSFNNVGDAENEQSTIELHQILETGIISVAQRWVQCATVSDTSGSEASLDRLGATPFHAEFYQLCMSLKLSRFALQYHKSLLGSACTALDALSGTCQVPISSIEQYLEYFYQLGNLYVSCRDYNSAVDTYNLVISAPTVSATNDPGSGGNRGKGTSIVQQGGGMGGVIGNPSGAGASGGTNSATSLAMVLINPIQIEARKKQLLVACLVASSAENPSMTAIGIKHSVSTTSTMMDHCLVSKDAGNRDSTLTPLDNTQHTVEDEEDDATKEIETSDARTESQETSQEDAAMPIASAVEPAPPEEEVEQPQGQDGDIDAMQVDEETETEAGLNSDLALKNLAGSIVFAPTVGTHYPWTLPAYISKSVARVLTSPFAFSSQEMQKQSLEEPMSGSMNPPTTMPSDYPGLVIGHQQSGTTGPVNIAAASQAEALSARHGLPLYHGFVKYFLMGDRSGLNNSISSQVQQIAEPPRPKPRGRKSSQREMPDGGRIETLFWWVKRDGNMGLCLEMIHEATDLRKALCVASVFEAVLWNVCESECWTEQKSSSVTNEADRMHLFALELAGSRTLTSSCQNRITSHMPPDFICLVEQDCGYVHFLDPLLHMQEEEDIIEDDFFPEDDSDDIERLSTNLNRVIDMTQRLTEMDIDVATSRAYKSSIEGGSDKKKSRAGRGKSSGGDI